MRYPNLTFHGNGDIVPVHKIPLWREDNFKTVIYPQWDFLYMSYGICIVKNTSVAPFINMDQL